MTSHTPSWRQGAKSLQFDLPFVIGVLADLAGNGPDDLHTPFPSRDFINIDQGSFSSFLREMMPQLHLRIPGYVRDRDLAPTMLDVELCFVSLDDFSPIGIARQLSALVPLLVTHLDGDDSSQSKKEAIDEAITKVVVEVLIHPVYKHLEAAWRGLHYLVFHVGIDETVVIRVLAANRSELSEDLLHEDIMIGLGLDQSHLYQQVHVGTYSQFGEPPYSLIVADYEFTQEPRDVALLQRLSWIASAAHFGLIAAASPRMSCVGSASEPDSPTEFDRPDTAYADWDSFRDSYESHFVALAMPHVFSRPPYFGDSAAWTHLDNLVVGRQEGFALLMNTAWIYAARAADFYTKSGWPGGSWSVPQSRSYFRLSESMLPFASTSGESNFCGSRNINIDHARQLGQLGIMSMQLDASSGVATFDSESTCHRPGTGDWAGPTGGSAFGAQFNLLLDIARFVHHIRFHVSVAVGAGSKGFAGYLSGWLRLLCASSTRESGGFICPLCDYEIEFDRGSSGFSQCRIAVLLKLRFPGKPVGEFRVVITPLRLSGSANVAGDVTLCGAPLEAPFPASFDLRKDFASDILVKKKSRGI